MNLAIMTNAKLLTLHMYNVNIQLKDTTFHKK